MATRPELRPDVAVVVDDALARAHAQAEQEGLQPSELRPRGFRANCPRCGAGRHRRDRLAVGPGDFHAVLAYCFVCASDVTSHFNGAAVALDPKEVARRRVLRARKAHEVHERLELVARARRPLGVELPLARLMWDPARLPDIGMFGDQVAFIIRTDDGAVDGVDLYVPPFTSERRRVDAEGGRKLSAVPGGHRGLWPRPTDVPSSDCLPGVLVAVEGAGTTSTMLGLGFSAIAFPSSRGIGPRDAERTARSGWKRALVLADADDVGRCGARASVVALRSVGVRAKAIDLTPDRVDSADFADLAREHTDIDTARAWLLRQLEPFTKGTT